MPGGFHNPLPASLSSECKKAAAILDSFINPTLVTFDKHIPRKILAEAKGLAIFTVFKVAALGSIRFGSGLIVARRADGTWSAPSAMATGGLGAGGQWGFELTDFVFVLNTDAAIEVFSRAGSLSLGGNLAMAVGPLGRSAEAAGVASRKGAAGVFAYSKSRGLFGGVTLEGGVLLERKDANRKMYGRKVSARELLGGEVEVPAEAAVLMRVLHSDAFGGSNHAVDEGVEVPRELERAELPPIARTQRLTLELDEHPPVDAEQVPQRFYQRMLAQQGDGAIGGSWPGPQYIHREDSLHGAERSSRSSHVEQGDENAVYELPGGPGEISANMQGLARAQAN